MTVHCYILRFETLVTDSTISTRISVDGHSSSTSSRRCPVHTRRNALWGYKYVFRSPWIPAQQHSKRERRRPSWNSKGNQHKIQSFFIRDGAATTLSEPVAISQGPCHRNPHARRVAFLTRLSSWCRDSITIMFGKEQRAM